MDAPESSDPENTQHTEPSGDDDHASAPETHKPAASPGSKRKKKSTADEDPTGKKPAKAPRKPRKPKLKPTADTAAVIPATPPKTGSSYTKGEIERYFDGLLALADGDVWKRMVEEINAEFAQNRTRSNMKMHLRTVAKEKLLAGYVE
ncbi:hypothetical protein EDC01DRAFT_633198 [Geopyxis carbonaria]|nr:hypothetical protein EDC01DRAFT_633198 [Geopyxis carbonaria]